MQLYDANSAIVLETRDAKSKKFNLLISAWQAGALSISTINEGGKHQSGFSFDFCLFSDFHVPYIV